MLLLAAATASFALVPGLLPAVVAAAALFGAVYIALTGVLLVWGTRTYPDSPALGVGAAFLLIAVGQALAAPVVGLLSDLVTAPIAFGAAALAAAGGAFALPRG
jgi:predicted MFS family arabinose efflux permease